MKTYLDKRSKLNTSKRGYRKYLIPRIRKYVNGCFYICENTNLHGFRHINMNESTIIENVFWFVICVSSIVFCVILMLRLWANYSKNPIATTVDTSNPIWDTSFPGVTICNNNKVYRPHADSIVERLYMNGFNANESEKFFSLLMKLTRPDNRILDENITAKQVLDNLGFTVETLMKKLMQPCSSLLVRCAWIGEIHDCNKLFKTVKSKEGFCCAFNSHYDLNTPVVTRKFNDTYYESKVYDNSNDLNVTSENLASDVHGILRAPGSGRDMGLAVALNVESHTYMATSRPYVGATIMIHDPIDFPDIGAHVVSVPPGHVLAISVTGTSIKSMESLRDLPLEKRSCYFDNELGETRYSYQSCVSECIAKYVQHKCGCMPFYYPEKHNGRTCYLPDLNCLFGVRKSMPEYAKMDTCRKCLPQCTDMMYDINPENVKMDDVGFDSDLMNGLDIHNTSFLYVFFGDVSYVEYRQESTISWDSLLASFGGIFGLCLGGSVISIIELIYLVIKELCKRQLRKRHDQSRASLPPASAIFLPNPPEKVQLQKPRDQRDLSDKRVFVTWYEPTLHRRKTTNFNDAHHRRDKF